MPERPRPDMNHTRDALRRHDERAADEPLAAPDEPEAPDEEQPDEDEENGDAEG